MTDLAVIRLAAGRELVARRKAFLVSTAVVTAVVVALLTVAAVLGGERDPTARIGVVGPAPEGFQARLESSLGLPVEVVELSDEGEATTLAAAGDVMAAVVAPDEVLWGPTITSEVAEAVVETLRRRNAERVGAELGLDSADLDRLLAPVQAGSARTGDEEDVAAEVLSVVSVILMFVAILAYGQWIAYGVVEEKANRVIELLLGAIRPHHLLIAKVASIGALGLAQLLVVGGIALGFGLATDRVEIPPVAGSTLAWLIVWFLLGYVFYGFLYAAAGSLAADTQGAGNSIGPLNLLPAIGYMAAVGSFAEGSSNLLLRVLSLLPPWAPLVMPGRIARGWAEPWEVALSVALMAAVAYGMVRLAGRIYLGGVTQATRSVGWREAFRAGGDVEGS